MIVIYPGPGQTYHPQLGRLIAGELFELDDEKAKKYIKSGLLKPAISKTKKTATKKTAARGRKKGEENGNTNRKRNTGRPEKGIDLAHSGGGRSK